MDTVKKVLDNRRNQVEQGEEQFLYTLTGVYELSFFLGNIMLVFLDFVISLLTFTGIDIFKKKFTISDLVF